MTRTFKMFALHLGTSQNTNCQFSKLKNSQIVGVIKRQGIKQSIVTYFGVGLGMINVLLIYPLCFEENELGILTYVRETALMLALFVMLGSAGVVVRFFPIFKNEDKGHNGFLFLMLCFLIIGIAIFLLAYYFLQDSFLNYFATKEEDPELYLQYLKYLIPFTVFVSFANLFTFYISNFQRIVIPTIFNELFVKVGLPILALAYFFDHLSLDFIFKGLVGLYFIILVGLVLYTKWLGQLYLKPNFSFLKKCLSLDIFNYSLYSFLGSVGARLSGGFISIFMVGTMDTPANTGVYTIAYFISNVIEVPRKAISKITAPLLADKWERGLIHEIADLYKRSSLNQFIIGLWMLLALWTSIDALFSIMPNGQVYSAGKYVVLILGASKIVDMVTGVNSEIISNSKYYRFNLYLVLLLAIINVVANIILIPKFHLIGAALATLLSLIVFNLAKYIVLKWKMDIQPFTSQTFHVLLIGTTTYFITYFLPHLDQPIIDMVFRSGVLTIIFFGLILILKTSPDIDDLFYKLFVWIKKQINKN